MGSGCAPTMAHTNSGVAQGYGNKLNGQVIGFHRHVPVFKGKSTEVYQFAVATTVSATVTPYTPVTFEDVSLLTVDAFPSSSTVATPSGWTLLISGVINTYLDRVGPDTKCYVFYRIGNQDPVTVTASGSSRSRYIKAGISTYGKDFAVNTGGTWLLSAAIDDYRFEVGL